MLPVRLLSGSLGVISSSISHHGCSMPIRLTLVNPSRLLIGPSRHSSSLMGRPLLHSASSSSSPFTCHVLERLSRGAPLQRHWIPSGRNSSTTSPQQGEEKPDLKLKKKKTPNDKFLLAFSWRSFCVIVVVGGSYVLFLRSIKKEKDEKLAKEQNKIIGQASLGGDWTLTRLDGTEGGSEDLRGNFALLYFGFTHCPDICPDEIEKAVKVVDKIGVDKPSSKSLIPVFITIDPDRDTPKIVENYIAEFSPKLVGYVGSNEEVNEASRKFRVYFSKGPVDEDGDYIVDHSIIMYLIGPDGKFLDYYGQNKKADEMAASISLRMAKWDAKELQEEKKKKGGFMAMLS